MSPADLLREHAGLFSSVPAGKPVLDLACGEGHNGIFLAAKGLPVVLADRSDQALRVARRLADRHGAVVRIWHVDLEEKGVNPLGEEQYAGIVVFRYLHRPLIPCVKKAVAAGGLLVYETYTVEQPRFGKPHNPDFLLRPGELREWYADWVVFHHYEGVREDPPRAVAQIVCRKPE